ncbi:uncharacterized protein LOC110461868 [Mizuhopecten yessoensis]|uniref:Cyclic GMP-AMP synthase n=1 Tax=Mizuhopecten yessoensis TaxID=6573 RepID=A0A210PZE8_MIZYE|nr:uncharacterized protein LOC110461868 [Mizuhopecten yessoensis]OWF41853.1 Cyclic GMP-AMP synthase [Mizuhopecten yessoensis]
MMIDTNVTVMYPGQCIPPNMACKTILYMRKADCRPGYVNLHLGQIGQEGQHSTEMIRNSLVRIANLTFVSSDIYREHNISFVNKATGVKHESNWPSCSFKSKIDCVRCFSCKSWPKEAKEWVTRTRLYGWPHKTLIKKIVDGGCFLVPIGDKCSEDTFLQWRLSFAPAETSLVTSFSHIQFKVYMLLKLFLKVIKETLKETIGDDDILYSYFLKTTLFHAIENSNQMFWQDKHLFYCFWFCLNILIAWVRAGFCPNYFFPTDNLFQRKVHGLSQQILLDCLNNYCLMKWECLSCLSFGRPFDLSIWKFLCKTVNQDKLVCPQTVQEIACRQDQEIIHSTVGNPPHPFNLREMKVAIHLLSTSHSDIDEVFTYIRAIKFLLGFATEQVYPDHMVATDNKLRYRSLRKCKRLMAPIASMGTGLLHLATFCFLTGDVSRALTMCQQVMRLASTYTTSCRQIPHAMFLHGYRPQRQTLDRLRKMYTACIIFEDINVCLPHLYMELSKWPNEEIIIPPLPYAVFLYFLCCHELGDTRGRDKALRHLIKVQYDDKQGGNRFYIVHTILGICYQTIGDNHRAIRAYWESAQSNNATAYYEGNPAIKRITVVYLCMYALQRSDRG